MGLMGTRAEPTALIGDQVFTDILGGNLLGVRTILVEPLSEQEFPTTRLVRRLERLIRAPAVQLAARRHCPYAAALSRRGRVGEMLAATRPDLATATSPTAHVASRH